MLDKDQRIFFQHHKLTPQQIEAAKLYRRDAFPQHMPCMLCHREWMAHNGLLCPQQDGYLSNIRGPNGKYVAVPPVFSATNIFVPDEAWDKEPDFDVQ